MQNLFTPTRIVNIFLLLMIIVLHSVLRISELPHSKPLIGSYFWSPSINFAAGKGFNDIDYSKSPELLNFVKNYFDGSFYGAAGNKQDRKSFSDTLHTFTDYEVTYNVSDFSDSNGYRLIVGIVWKYFGFNWYFVGYINYFFSLIALLSLMYCSYKTLGPAYSFAIGLLYSVSTVEIHFLVNYGRDGLPLWFASYLICALIMFFNKQMTPKRIVNYSVLIGFIIFGAIEGRSSSIYFFPLVIAIYFLMFFFFQKEKIIFKYSYLFKNTLFNNALLFTAATVLTFFSVFIFQLLTRYAFSMPTTVLGSGGFMHVTYLGLGMWKMPDLLNPIYTHPSQVRYDDVLTRYHAMGYGKRVLGYSEIAYLSDVYGESLKNLYFSIMKTYPAYFIDTVFLNSFSKTLISLGEPLRFTYASYCSLNSIFSKYIYNYTYKLFDGGYLFTFSLIGSFLLYFILKAKKTCVILLSFVFLNAAISFLQYNPRHSLMGHPAYYFLSGSTLGFIYLFIKRSCVRYIKCGVLNAFFQDIEEIRKIDLRRIASLIKIKYNYLTISFLLIVILSIPAYKILVHKLYAIERNNIKAMQVFYDSREKKPLEFGLDQKNSRPPSFLIGKTIGVYCNIGLVTTPKEINIAFYADKALFYNTTISPVKGNDVVVFIPFFYYKINYNIIINSDQQCKSYYWSDLKDWKGPLWEGSYDRETLAENP